MVQRQDGRSFLETSAFIQINLFFSYLEQSHKMTQSPNNTLKKVFERALVARNELLSFEDSHACMEKIDQKLKEAIQLVGPHFLLQKDQETQMLVLKVQERVEQKLAEENGHCEPVIPKREVQPGVNLTEVLDYHCVKADLTKPQYCHGSEFVCGLDTGMLVFLFKRRAFALWFPLDKPCPRFYNAAVLTPAEVIECRNNPRFMKSYMAIFEHVMKEFGFHDDRASDDFVWVDPPNLDMIQLEFHYAIDRMLSSLLLFAPRPYVQKVFNTLEKRINNYCQSVRANGPEHYDARCFLSSLRALMKNSSPA